MAKYRRTLAGQYVKTAGGAYVVQYPTVTLGDYQEYGKGPWMGYMSAFNSASYVSGQDYLDTMTLAPEIFPDATLISWTWPDIEAPNGVYGFLHISHGNVKHTFPPTPIAPARVSSLGSLTITHAITLEGNLPGFNVIVDMFLTSAAGDHTTDVWEIEVMLHTSSSGLRYINGCTPLGSFTDAQGRSWRVVRNPATPIVLFIPQGDGDMLSGSVDIKEMLQWLAARGTISGAYWYNGLGVGVEPTRGAGTAMVDHLAITYSPS